MGNVTSDPEMLQQVARVTHQFLSFLADVVPRGEVKCSNFERNVVHGETDKLFKKHATVPAEPLIALFVSSGVLQKEKDGHKG